MPTERYKENNKMHMHCLLHSSTLEPRHEKITLRFQTWSYTNQAVQLQKMARCLKCRGIVVSM